MINPDTEQVFRLSDYFDKLSNSMGSYLDFNKGNMQADERNRLYDLQIELARLAGEINMIGVNLVFDDVQNTILQLDKITGEVKKAVKKALAVQQAIDIASGIVSMATAIISADPKAIAQKTAALGKVLKIKIS